MKSMMVASSAVTAIQRQSEWPRIIRPAGVTTLYTGRMTFKVFLQYMVPHRALSRMVYWATRWTFVPWKNWLIGTIVRNYDVDMGEAAQSDALAYQHFNAFFTRKLRADARRADSDPAAVLCP